MENFDKANQKLKDLIQWYSSNEADRNEATTRLHLIDVMVKDILQWPYENIECETSHDGEYSDYTLSKARALIIIEAKKEGNYFEIPKGNSRIKYSIKSIARQNSNLKTALAQVSGYCQKRGIQIAVVTNGIQYVVFVAVRIDGIPPLEGQAFVFESLEDIDKKFTEFWNCLSYGAIDSNYVLNKLIGEQIQYIPVKPSASLLKYPGTKGRNPFQANMQILSELVLQDVIRDDELEESFLNECYSKSGALSQYTTASKELLKTRYKFLFEINDEKVNINSVVNKKGISADLRDLLSNSIARRPVMLIGDVGVGKSTFIDNLIKVEAKEVFQKSIGLKVDLGSNAVLKKDLREAIFDEIENILISTYSIDIQNVSFIKGVYHLEIQRFRNGPVKILLESRPELAVEKEFEFLQNRIQDRGNHIKCSLEHLSKARKEQIIIFIDNCDQRDDEAQQMAFLAGQEIAENWPALVFITLRPETFHRSYKQGALSGYHPKAFTINPPRIDDVILKRLEFAKKIACGMIPIRSINIGGDFTSLSSLLDVLIYSIKNNRYLVSFIDNISNGNVRVAIDYVIQFLGSGHVDTSKILDIYNRTGKYLIPLHEFQRAVIYGDNVYYDPRKTTIVNLYEVISSDLKEHFIAPTLLSLLQGRLSVGKRDGFIETNKVYADLQSLGYTVFQIDNVIDKLYRTKLIERSQRGDIIDDSSQPKLIRITSLGSYHITIMINEYVYNDAIIIDTPILTEEYQELIKDDGRINERLNNVLAFYDYLRNCWGQTDDNHYNLYNWIESHDKVLAEVSSIKKKV